MQNKQSLGHLAAIITIIIWGTTFVATKVLLRTFTPVEILMTRFVIGYIALLILKPGLLKLQHLKQELWFVGAGLSGVTIYYLLENIALTYTTASNVGIITSISPFMTAILSVLFLRTRKPSWLFYVGFIVSMTGVLLLNFQGGAAVHVNPVGDILALLATVAWATYSVITHKIGELNLNVIQATRHIFFYGILFMLPLTFFFDFKLDSAQLMAPINLGNLLYLGLGACALCFVTWNSAVKILGPVRSSLYIYLIPVITLVFSVWLLHEPLTPMLIVGAALTLVGLWLSENSQH